MITPGGMSEAVELRDQAKSYSSFTLTGDFGSGS
jgi:hypothetical protein